MTCLEHLIENQLVRFEEHPEKTYAQYIDDIKSDINFEGAGITAEQCYEIMQYVLYSYCVCRPSAQSEPIWHPYPEEKPKEAGEYLVAQECDGAIYYSIASFGTSRWVEKSQKSIKAKKHHRYWYKYDSEWGDYVCDNVIAWMPIPEYEKEKANDTI